MKRPVVWTGLIIVVVGLVLVFAGQNILGTTNIGLEAITLPSTGVRQENSSSTDYVELFETPTYVFIPIFYSTIIVQTLLIPSVQGQQFTITLAVRFPNQNYGACPRGQICDLPAVRTLFTSQSTNARQVNLQIQQTSLFNIPFIVDAHVQVDSSQVRHQYYLKIDSDNSFSYEYQTIIQSNLIVIVGKLITIFGIVFLLIQIKKNRGKQKPVSVPVSIPSIKKIMKDSLAKIYQFQEILAKHDEAIKLTELSKLLYFEEETSLIKWLLQFDFHGYTLHNGNFQINSKEDLLISINSYLKVKNIWIIRFGLFILVFQHLFPYLFPFLGLNFPNFLIIFLTLDLIGFLLLGIGFIVHANRSYNYKLAYQTAGGAFISWFILRILWQYIFSGGRQFWDPVENDQQIWDNVVNMLNTSFIVPYIFLLSGVALFIASVVIWYLLRGFSGFTFLVYGMINLIGVILLFSGVLLKTTDIGLEAQFKMVLVPIFGLLAFFLFLLKSSKLINQNFNQELMV